MSEQMKGISIRLPETSPPESSHDATLPRYDYTKLTAINTCPTWGIVRYGLHLSMADGPRTRRPMALEAGHAAHECFAAVRLIELRNQGEEELFHYHGARIFGEYRFPSMLDQLEGPEDDRTKQLNFMLSALHTGSFEEDERDRRRSLTNIEEMLIGYFDRWPWGRSPVWVGNATEAHPGLVGIEVPVDMIITYRSLESDNIVAEIRYTGRCDGIHIHSEGPRPHENKTGARIDDTWVAGMHMTHQVTGYMVFTHLLTGQPVHHAVVLGAAIPTPRGHDFGGFVRERVSRTQEQIDSWAAWVLHTHMTYEVFKKNPHTAPKFTHSCTRYFRPCSMIPFCAAPIDEQVEMLSNMEYDPWDPLAD